MFWYYVAPYTDKTWNVLFENQHQPHIYDSEDKALDAARKAAEDNFRKNGAPSGVKVKEDGRWREDWSFGAD